MATKISLVQGDTNPKVVLKLTGTNTRSPINLSGATVVMKFRQSGETALKDTLSCQLLPGLQKDDGTLDMLPPYNVPGSGGVFAIIWKPDSLALPGLFEGEVSVTFSDGSVQAGLNIVRFRVREQF